MKVSEDGQRWYAWRCTPSGHYFGIGAADKPPDEWLYDGPIPPSDFPGSAPGWEKAAQADAALDIWLS